MIKAHLDDKYPDKIVISEFEWRYKERIANIPGANWRKDKYIFPMEWPVAVAMKNDLGDLLVLSDELKDWMNDLYTNKIAPSYELRNVVSSDNGLDFLYPHQRADVEFISTARRAILANDLGSGKSISSMASIRHMHEELGEDVFPILIVAPNSTKFSWEREVEIAWPGLKTMVIEGTAAQRRKQFKTFMDDEYQVLIMNWDLLRHHSRLKSYGSHALKRCVDCGGLDPNVKVTVCEVHQKELNEISFKSVIGDEIHRISDPSTKISRAFKAASGDADIRIALSGTPINASPEQIYSALNWLYPEAYPSKVKFIDRFCELTPSTWGPPTIQGILPDKEQEFFMNIDPILRRMPKNVILPFLPPVVRTRRSVEMGAKQAKAYKQMLEHKIAEVGEDDAIVAVSALTQLMRLMQFSSAYAELHEKKVHDPNSPFLDSFKTVTELKLTEPSAKIDAFMDDLPDYGDSSIVVFAQFKQLIDLLAARMDKAGIRYGLITGDQDARERKHFMDAFQEGKIKYILCTIQAGGTGITLTKADTMVFLQRSYSMIDNIQAEGRAHRIGSEQHESINIVDYITEGTVDERVIEAIDNKKDALEFILRDDDLTKEVFGDGENVDFSDVDLSGGDSDFGSETQFD